MMKHEFESIAKRTVTDDQYKMIESTLNKYNFIKSIKGLLNTIPEETNSRKIIIGVAQMPNGTWMNYEAEIIKINIKTGKYEVKRLSENRCWAETYFDVHCSKVEEIA